MKQYCIGFVVGLVVAGSVAGAQWLTPQEMQRRQEQQRFELQQQQQIFNQMRQNQIQQEMLKAMERPCY